MNKNIALCMLGLFAGVIAVSAEVLEDFEPGSTYIGEGVIEADPLDPANHVLNLASGEVATFIPTDFEGIVTMRIYDHGEVPIGGGSGPRWGVAYVDDVEANESAAVAIVQKNGWLESNVGYGYGNEISRTSNWWSPKYYGGPRQTGLWTTWTFEVADGKVGIISFGSQIEDMLSPMNEIWVSGGALGESSGVLVDDITFSAFGEQNPLILLDTELQTFEHMGIGFELDAITDLAGDPGTQVDVTLFFTNGATTDGVHIGVPMGKSTAYEGESWKIDIANTNSFAILIQQKFILSGWAWTNAGSTSAWILSGATNSFAVTVPPGEIEYAMLMVLAESTLGSSVPTSIQIIGPTPAVKTPTELYLNWAADYGLTNINTTAALDYDVEPDGMDNLLEYALGGNPINPDASTIQPTATILDGDTWEYVYKRYRNAADRALTYDLQTAGALVGGSWVSSAGMYETGTNTTDAAFDVITNTVPGLGSEMFIKLEVTENF